MAITLTPAAADRVRHFLSERGHGIGLRLGIRKTGCSGYSYGMTFAESQQEGDWVGEFGGVKVFVDPQSAPVLNGVEVDWVETLQATGFAIRNPNAARSCGCGKSFETH